MQTFSFQLTTKIYFGTDITRQALEQERSRLAGNLLIVTTGRSLISHGHLARLVSCLENTGKVTIFDKVSQNPRLEEVREAIRIGKENRIDTIIGFGGGSALDAAKAVALGIPAKEDIGEYLLNGKEPSQNVLPMIAIPTTAGSGSELSRAAILSSPAHHIKAGIRGKSLLPQVAIVDARYTWTIPRKTTMETGFDVLAHGAESYLAVKANPFSEMLSEKAIRIAGECLPILWNQPAHPEAREKMCFASMLMGMNLANVGTCLPHRMQYPVGAATDTSHAAGLLALYPAWIRYEYDVNQEKVRDIVQWLTGNRPQDGQQAQREVELFLRKIDCRYALRDLGITMDMAEELCFQVTGNLKNDRLAEIPHAVRMIYEDSM